MKRMTFALVVLALLIAACGPSATQEPPASTPLPPTPTQFVPPETSPTSPTRPPVDLTPAQLAALNALAQTLDLPVEHITLASTEAVDWPDACLGVMVHGVACAQVVTPGFSIVLETDGLSYEYHTNQDGTSLRGATLAMYWSRVGGIAGFCDDLWIYRTGEVYAASCKYGGAYPTGQLTAEEAGQLAAWVKAYGTVGLESKDPAVADAMELRLDLNGAGAGQPSQADKTAMFNWAQAVYERVKP